MRTMLRILLLFVCGLVVGRSLAQGPLEDVVYLKNGSIIRGIIIEQVPNVSLKIQTVDRNVFVFKIEEVEKMTREPMPKRGGSSRSGERSSGFPNEDIKKRGYTFIGEIGPAFGFESIGDGFSMGLQIVNGYKVNRHFFAGVGVGFNRHLDAAFMPVFLDLRGYFLPTRATPFIDLAGGWAFDPAEEGSGAYFAPSFGLQTYLRPNVGLQFSLGFRFQESYWVRYDYIPELNIYEPVEERRPINALTFRFGVTI